MLSNQIEKINQKNYSVEKQVKEIMVDSNIENLGEKSKECKVEISSFDSASGQILMSLNDELKNKEKKVSEAKGEVSFWGKISFGLFDSDDHAKHKELKKDLDLFKESFNGLKTLVSDSKSTLLSRLDRKKESIIEAKLVEDHEYADAKSNLIKVENDSYFLNNISNNKKVLDEANDVKNDIRRAYSEIDDAVRAERQEMYSDDDNSYADQRSYWETEEANDAIERVNRKMRQLGDSSRSIETVSNGYFELFDFSMLDISRLDSMEDDLRRTERRLEDVIRDTESQISTLKRDWKSKQEPFKRIITEKRTEVISKYKI